MAVVAELRPKGDQITAREIQDRGNGSVAIPHGWNEEITHLQTQLGPSDWEKWTLPLSYPAVDKTNIELPRKEEAKAFMSMRALYPKIDEVSPSPLRHALHNLKEALNFVEEALDADADEDALASDNAIMQFRRILPDLFCSRSIGDGFGMIINSLMIWMRARNGEPLNKVQLEAVRMCLSELAHKPLLSDMRAVSLIQRLQSAGLNPYRPALDFVADE
jgi:hypothetical protein